MTPAPEGAQPISPELKALRAPAPLLDLPFWLVWANELHPGEAKARKIPFYANGGKRKGVQGTAEDLGKLTTFAMAKEAAIRRGMAGVGFAAAIGHDYCFLDFDHCVKNGEIDPEVLALVGNTYHEFSPSGTGVRAVVKGKLGNSKSRATPDRFGFEVFSTNGFCTFTGNLPDHVEILGTEDHIAPISPALRAFCDSRFQYSAKQADLEEDFTIGHEPRLGLSYAEIEQLLEQLDPDMGREDWIRVGLALHHETEGDETGFYLWNDWSGLGGKYPSEEALREQWDSFDRRQGVRRKNITMTTVKWMTTQNDLRLEPTPEQIVERAVKIAGNVHTGADFTGRFKVFSPTDLQARPQAGWWIKGVLPKADLAVIYGASGSGKSFWALNVAAHLSVGREWCGRKTAKAKVLLVVAEGAGGYGNRLEAVAAQLGVPLGELDIGIITAAPNILDADDITEVIASAMACGAEIIFWDTYAQVTPGANENSGEDMGRALSNLRTIREATGAMNVLIHHSGKDASKGARGWSGLRAAADVETEIVRPDSGPRFAQLTKLKDGQDDLKFPFTLDILTIGHDEDGDAITTCLVTQTDAPIPVADGERKGGKRRPRMTMHLIEMAETVRDRSAMPLADFVDLCSDALPGPDAGKRDTRRQIVTRALHNLAREKDGPIGIQGGIVVFYEG